MDENFICLMQGGIYLNDIPLLKTELGDAFIKVDKCNILQLQVHIPGVIYGYRGGDVWLLSLDAGTEVCDHYESSSQSQQFLAS